MAELDGEVVVPVQDWDILAVIEDADALLARLVADGELLTRANPRQRLAIRDRTRRSRGRK